MRRLERELDRAEGTLSDFGPQERREITLELWLIEKGSQNNEEYLDNGKIEIDEQLEFGLSIKGIKSTDVIFNNLN